MICISINQQARPLVLVDMLNAASQCDLLEIRLDTFPPPLEIGDLLSHKPKPVIMSCRRIKDGGNFIGLEDERLAILRQCIISRADYVEIELDVADAIRRFPPAQRVIVYTNLQETPANIAEIYAEAMTKSPDVIKITTLARTPEEAWPLVQVLATATVPTVVVGLGKPGIMLSLLAKRMGAPWTYAALERGMEAYPGQPIVRDLHERYHLDKIDSNTRFVGVTGFGPREMATVAALNAALAHQELNNRCLPMGIGNVKLFGKVMDAVKMAAAVIDSEHQRDILDIGVELHQSAQAVNAADVLVHRQDTWTGYQCAGSAWTHALAEALPQRPGIPAFQGRTMVVVGLNETARIMASEVMRKGGQVILASYQRKAGAALAEEVGCRFLTLETLHTSEHDVLIVCDQDSEDGRAGVAALRAAYLKPEVTVMDLTATLTPTKFLQDAHSHGCQIVDPRRVTLAVLELQARTLTGKPVPAEVLAAALPEQGF